MGFVPNSQLIMQRKPKILKAFGALSSAVNDPDGKVPNNFKRLIGHVASRAAGCQYCMAHTAEGAHKQGIDDQKLDAVWNYQTSPLFTPAERAALDVAARQLRGASQRGLTAGLGAGAARPQDDSDGAALETLGPTGEDAGVLHGTFDERVREAEPAMGMLGAQLLPLVRREVDDEQPAAGSQDAAASARASTGRSA